MIVHSTRAELIKVRHRPAIWGLGAFWIAAGLIFGYLIPYLLYRSGNTQVSLPELLPAGLVDDAMQGFPLFGVMIAVVLGVLVTASEYSWGTITTMLIQRPSRLDVLAGKALALGAVLAGFALALFASVFVASNLVAVIAGGSHAMPTARDLLLGPLAGVLIMWMGGALGMAIGTITRSTGIGIGIGLVYVAVIEGLVDGLATKSSVLRHVGQVLPGGNATSVASSFLLTTSTNTGLTPLVGGVQGAIVVALYLGAFVAVSAVFFVRRDVTGRSG